MNGASYIPIAHRDLLFVDTETSGTDPAVHEIIELAAVRVRSDFSKEIGSMSQLCIMQRPGDAAKEALEVNRYDAREWNAKAVHIRVALIELGKLLGHDDEVVLVGHNVAFDWDFIRAAAANEGPGTTDAALAITLPKPKTLIDTMSIAWPLAVKGHIDKISLDALCSKYRVSNEGHHRALADVRRTISIYKRLLGLEAA